MLKLASRGVIRFHASQGRFKRGVLRTGHAIYMAVPPPLRRHVASGYIAVTLLLKRVLRVEEQTELTPLADAGTLSFWGVPKVDIATFSLTVEGAVERAFGGAVGERAPSIDGIAGIDGTARAARHAAQQGAAADLAPDAIGHPGRSCRAQ